MGLDVGLVVLGSGIILSLATKKPQWFAVGAVAGFALELIPAFSNNSFVQKQLRSLDKQKKKKFEKKAVQLGAPLIPAVDTGNITMGAPRADYPDGDYRIMVDRSDEREQNNMGFSIDSGGIAPATDRVGLSNIGPGYW